MYTRTHMLIKVYVHLWKNVTPLASITLWYLTKLLLWVSAAPEEEEPQAPVKAGAHFLKCSFA